MLDADPALFVTWLAEIERRDDLERVRSEWTTEHELIAQVVDQLSVTHAQYVRFNVKPGTRLDPPRFVPRPGRPDPNELKSVTPRQLAQQMMGR